MSDRLCLVLGLIKKYRVLILILCTKPDLTYNIFPPPGVYQGFILVGSGCSSEYPCQPQIMFRCRLPPSFQSSLSIRMRCVSIFPPTSPLPPPGRYTLSFLTASCTGCFLALMSDTSHRKPLPAESSVVQPTTFSLSQLSMCLSGGRLLLECASTLPVSSAKLLVISTQPVSADCGVSLQPFLGCDWPSGGAVCRCNVVPPSCPILCREQNDREGRAHQAPSLSCWTNWSDFLSLGIAP